MDFPTTERVKIIDSIIKRLDQMSLEEALDAMLLVESVRRGSGIYKGGFEGMYARTDPEEEYVIDKVHFELAVTSFKRWWQTPGTPEAKLSKSPQAGTSVEIYEAP